MATFQRVALYIVFDAIERDLIATARKLLGSLSGPLLNEEQETRAKDRILRRGREGLYDLSDHFDLLHGLDLGDKIAILLRHKEQLSATDATYYQSVKPRFDKAISVRADVMHGRPLTVDDYVIGFGLANDLIRDSTYWPELSATLKDLNERPDEIVSSLTSFIEEETSSGTLHNLPRPDYDDTGFVPRGKLEAELKRKILGRHPVITVLGDGGNGKTALLLQVAYRLASSDDHHFDAIIWVSAKATTLSTAEIERIEGAITTSVGIFSQIATFEPGSEEPLDRVKKLMLENKILLIIDNLETVLDEAIQSFAEEIPGESKLVLTSRVPLGSDLTVRVGEFSSLEAETFLRRLVQAYSVSALANKNSVDLQRYSERLNLKPLLLKWFALGVLSGLQPDQILQSPQLALKFCLENVVGRLHEDSKKIAIAFANLAGSHSAPVIQYITALSALEVEAGIAELKRFNLLEDDVVDATDRTYKLRLFPKEYLTTIEAPRRDFVQAVIMRQRQIGTIFQTQAGAAAANRYLFRHFTVRSRAEALVVVKMREAIKLSERGDFVDALKIIEETASLSPNYFELFRIQASIKAHSGDVAGARASYERAIEIDSNQPQIYFWYGGFVLRWVGDYNQARELFKRAYQLDSGSSAVLREWARTELFCAQFESAQQLISAGLALPQKSVREEIIFYDLQSQVYLRRSQNQAAAGDFVGALSSLSELKDFLSGLDSGHIDERLREHVDHSIHHPVHGTLTILKFRAPSNLREAMRDHESWFDKFQHSRYSRVSFPPREESTPSYQDGQSDGVTVGAFRPVGASDQYGFIVDQQGREVFVHKSAVASQTWTLMLRGVNVTFEVSKDVSGRYRAVNVNPTPWVSPLLGTR